MSYSLAVEVWKKGETKYLLNKFFPKFIYSLNRINNKKISYRDVECAFKHKENEDFEFSNRLNICIKNHIILCKKILDIIEENNSKLSIDLIKYFHNEFTKNCFTEELLISNKAALDLKNNNIETISEELQQNLDLLIKEINESEINENTALNMVSYLYCNFEKIKPFVCCNELVGMILINYLLIVNNLPPIVIFENDKEGLYLALEYFNSTNEVAKMVAFLENQSYKTWVKDYNFKLKSLKDFLK